MLKIRKKAMGKSKDFPIVEFVKQSIPVIPRRAQPDVGIRTPYAQIATPV